MQHLNKEVEGQLLRQPHVRIENWKLSSIMIQKNTDWLKDMTYNLQLYEGVAFLPNSKSQTEEDSFWILNNLLCLYI